MSVLSVFTTTASIPGESEGSRTEWPLVVATAPVMVFAPRSHSDARKVTIRATKYGFPQTVAKPGMELRLLPAKHTAFPKFVPRECNRSAQS